jgi:integrase
MGRPATGSVTEYRTAGDVSFYLRFSAGGRKRHQRCGKRSEGWNRVRAQKALEDTMAEVQLGIWRPPAVEVEESRECPTFWAFATDWFAKQSAEGGRYGGGLTKAGKDDLKWRLNCHLRHFFGTKKLDEITVADVDRYRLVKVREGRLNATSINKTIEVLSAILELAVEHEFITRNVARGKRRRLPSIKPRRSWLDRAEHIAALLEGASEVDAATTRCRGKRRALLATLTFAGLRLGEALNLRWKDVDLARGTISVRDAKTDAGIRTVDVLPILRDELDAYRARLDPAPDSLVFGTKTGRKENPTNVRRRMLAPAVEKANKALKAKRQEPLPDGLRPHDLRRTFASLLFAINEKPPYVMAQLGHVDPKVTLGIYAKQMDRRDGEPERLRALVEGEFRQRMDEKAADTAPVAVAGTQESP